MRPCPRGSAALRVDTGAAVRRHVLPAAADPGRHRTWPAPGAEHRPCAASGAPVGLDWAGYGDAFLIAEDNLLAPGQTVDFPVALPAPNCSHVSGPVVGVVDAGTATVRTPLDGPGSVLLRRNRRIACGEKLVQHRLAIEYGRSWRLTGAGAGTAMAGHMRLTRRTGSEEIRLVRAEGSVLYDLELPGPSVLPADASSLAVPLLVRPGNRCDEHAHSQASAPFAFRLIVKIGEERADVDLTPPPAVQAKAPALLRRACR